MTAHSHPIEEAVGEAEPPHVHSEMCIRWDQSGYVCKQLEDEDNLVSVDRRVLERAIQDYETEWGHSPRPDAWPNVLRLLLGVPSGVELNAK